METFSSIECFVRSAEVGSFAEAARRFVRLDPARGGSGAGLGLSLVQRICENQGWTVSLSTMEPNGCRFEVDLGHFGRK